MDITALQMQLQQLQATTTPNELDGLRKRLIAGVNHLINHNFEKLVQLLYTIDVDEKSLKSLLQGQPQQDAAVLIAHLMINRQLQKAKWRQQFQQKENESGEEGW